MRRVVGIKADATKVVQLGSDAGQNADDILCIAHDGSPHVRVAKQTSIYSNDPGFWPVVRDYDVSTGRSKIVQNPVASVMNWQAAASGTIRLGLSYQDDSRACRVLYREDATKTFRTIDKARGSAASLGDTPALFLAEPGKAIAYSDAEGFDALYSYDLTTLKTGARLFGVPAHDLDGLISDDLGTRLLGVRYADTRMRTHWFAPGLEEVQAGIDKAVGTREARIVSWNRDFTVLLVRVGMPATSVSISTSRWRRPKSHLVRPTRDIHRAEQYRGNGDQSGSPAARISSVSSRARAGSSPPRSSWRISAGLASNWSANLFVS